MPAPTKQMCHVYELAENLVFLSSSRTTVGIWIFNGFAQRAPADAGATDVGSLALRSLGESGAVLEHPRDWSEFNRRSKVILNSVGVSSFARLHRSARSVEVTRSERNVTVTPCESGGWSGPNRGFHEITNLAASLMDPSDTDLGNTVRASLDLCR
jgi:hypothetical protein